MKLVNRIADTAPAGAELSIDAATPTTLHNNVLGLCFAPARPWGDAGVKELLLLDLTPAPGGRTERFEALKEQLAQFDAKQAEAKNSAAAELAALNQRRAEIESGPVEGMLAALEANAEETAEVKRRLQAVSDLRSDLQRLVNDARPQAHREMRELAKVRLRERTARLESRRRELMGNLLAENGDAIAELFNLTVALSVLGVPGGATAESYAEGAVR